MLFSDCDPLTGTCRGCLRHTTGPRCEACAPGFYGNALLPGNCTRRRGWGHWVPWGGLWAYCPAGAALGLWLLSEGSLRGSDQPSF